MELLFASCLLIILVSWLAGIMDIVKARRKKEKIYYFFSGLSFLVGIFVTALLFGQFLLSLIVLGIMGLMGFFLLPERFKMHKQEFIAQKQEIDLSVPLVARDFLNWSAWIKLKAIYGFRKMMIIYIVSTITIVVAILVVFIVLGIIPDGPQMYFVIMGAAIPVIMNYYQSWKILKRA